MDLVSSLGFRKKYRTAARLPCRSRQRLKFIRKLRPLKINNPCILNLFNLSATSTTFYDHFVHFTGNSYLDRSKC